MRVFEALAAIRSSRFDQPFTYAAAECEVRIGDVVRVPLGSRDVVAFAVSDSHDGLDDARIKPMREKLPVPRAFDPIGLKLARFIAEYYVCTLGEALSAVVLAAAIPRMVDSFFRTVSEPHSDRFPSVPVRLLRLIWEELPDGFSLESLLRHPEARRAGDRAALLRYVTTIVKSGALRRERRLRHPKSHEYVVRVLEPGDGAVRGSKARALVELVRAAPGIPRADAILAGFSHAVITRACTAGAIVERASVPSRKGSRDAALGRTEHPPTAEQRRALDTIYERLDARSFGQLLLHGVTGSGKTYVYLEAIKRVVAAGGRAIVLVPEISLTPQTARRFETEFGDRVAVLHSALSDRERFDAWQACARGEVDVVVGARSAVFAPLPGVRLLVVDEAHEHSYKQDGVPRYSAVTVARERMRLENGLLLLGTATPSLETYESARRGRLKLLTMDSRATSQPMPSVSIVDLVREFEAGNRRIFSSALVEALRARLACGEKAVLFVNRRGSAGFVLCRSCGFVPECPRCDVSLTAHRAEGLLRCHYCDYQTPLREVCSRCGFESIREFGIGTERVAEEVTRLFGTARVLRMDSDTTTHVGDHARILSEFETRGDVLVGTQMVAKGLDYPTVTLVGVVAADIGLHAPDFRAAERTFALIAQVCGRSGRATPGEAIVQTYSPTHPAIVYAANHDYRGFAEFELRERRALEYPPFARLVYLGVISRKRGAARDGAERYATLLKEAGAGDVLGPAPYPIPRMNDEWRMRVAIKTREPRRARTAIRERIVPLALADRETRLSINVDP